MFRFNVQLREDGSVVAQPQEDAAPAAPAAPAPAAPQSAVERFSLAELQSDADEDEATSWVTSEPRTGLQQYVAAPSAAVAGSVDEASGQQLWECALDLVECVKAEHAALVRGRRVLELGCGHGLPGAWCLARGDAASVLFHDNSSRVLRGVTARSVALNGTPEQCERAAFVSGDWRALALPSCDVLATPFDLVLGAECVYSADSTAAFVAALRRALAPDGVALVATKTLYFGVGGGSLAFRRALDDSAAGDGGRRLRVQVVKEYADFKSNMREVLRVTWEK